MSRIIGDRTRNTLEEMEEVARERNRDVAEEERQEALRKAEEAKNPKAPSKPVIIEPTMEDIVDFHGRELFRRDAEALKELYKTIGKEYDKNRVEIREKRVSHLGLYEYNLTEVPDVIGELSGLQLLELNRNQLAQLPDCIGELSGLQSLYLNKNQLKQIPDSIGNLSGLQYLSLGDNQLAQIPSGIGQLSRLQRLFLYNNQLVHSLTA